jgi:hypothetical protein
MKWEKLGKIFDPSILPESMRKFEFAKSPQALVFDDFVRIYFSGQVRSENGKYLSYPFYLEMDKTMRHVLRVSEEPVMDLGGLGCFDEHGIFPFHVMRDGAQIYAYTTGWSRRTAVSIDMSIGLAIGSPDGRSFKRIGGGGPVMTATSEEAFLVGDGFVRRYGDEFYMWYIYGDRWQLKDGKEPDRFYKIAGAKSQDGIHWQRDGKYIVDTALEDECQALPTVFEYEGRYHMYFCFRSAFDFRTNSKNAYRLGYAWSADLKQWNRDDALSGMDLSETGWDSEMMCYPHVFECDDQVYMLYNGNEFGRYGFGLARLIP